jgi:hypothetical protein
LGLGKKATVFLLASCEARVEAGSKKQEARSRKQEAGSRKQEADRK